MARSQRRTQRHGAHAPGDGGVVGSAAAIAVLVVAELVTGGRVAGVLAASRSVVLVALLTLVAQPVVWQDVRVPDVVAAVLVAAGTAIDQIAAASRYAPQLVGMADLRGLHLVAALLVGVAATIVGMRARHGAGIAVAAFGVAAVVIAGGAVHADAPGPWYAGLLAAQALISTALAVAAAARRPSATPSHDRSMP